MAKRNRYLSTILGGLVGLISVISPISESYAAIVDDQGNRIMRLGKPAYVQSETKKKPEKKETPKPKTKNTQIKSCKTQIHTIKAGDTLSDIAKQYKVSRKDLESGFANPHLIKPGQEVCIPGKVAKKPTKKLTRFERGTEKANNTVNSLLEQGKITEATERVDKYERFCKSNGWSFLGKGSKKEEQDRLKEAYKLRKLVKDERADIKKANGYFGNIIDTLILFGDEVQQRKGNSFYDVDEEQLTGPLSELELALAGLKGSEVKKGRKKILNEGLLTKYLEAVNNTIFKRDDSRAKGLEERTETLAKAHSNEEGARMAIDSIYELFKEAPTKVSEHLGNLYTTMNRFLGENYKVLSIEHKKLITEMEAHRAGISNAEINLDNMADEGSVGPDEDYTDKTIGELIGERMDAKYAKILRKEAVKFSENEEYGKSVRKLKEALKFTSESDRPGLKKDLESATGKAREKFRKMVAGETSERQAFGTRRGQVRIYLERSQGEFHGETSWNYQENKIGLEARFNDREVDLTKEDITEGRNHRLFKRLFGILEAYRTNSFGPSSLGDTYLERSEKVIEIGGGAKFLMDVGTGRYYTLGGGLEIRKDKAILNLGKHNATSIKRVEGTNPFIEAARNTHNTRLWLRGYLQNSTEQNEVTLHDFGITAKAPDKKLSGVRYRVGAEAYTRGNKAYVAAEFDKNSVSNALGHDDAYVFRGRAGVVPLTKFKWAGPLRHTRFEVHGEAGKFRRDTYRTSKIGARVMIPLYHKKVMKK